MFNQLVSNNASNWLKEPFQKYSIHGVTRFLVHQKKKKKKHAGWISCSKAKCDTSGYLK